MVKVKEVVPAFPSAIVTSSILNDGNATVIGVQTGGSLSTAAHAWPLEELVDVNVDCAWPEVIVPGVPMVPLVALKLTATCGTKSVTEGTTLFELRVISAVTVEVSPGAIEAGDALTPRTIRGLKSMPAPPTLPQPVLFGPALQPHQLFSIEPLTVPAKPAPVF